MVSRSASGLNVLLPQNLLVGGRPDACRHVQTLLNWILLSTGIMMMMINKHKHFAYILLLVICNIWNFSNLGICNLTNNIDETFSYCMSILQIICYPNCIALTSCTDLFKSLMIFTTLIVFLINLYFLFNN